MSDVEQIRDDLQFVRSAIARRERTDTGPSLILYVWAVYVIVGYTLMDTRPAWAGPFFGIGGFVGGLLSGWIGRRYAREAGQWDRDTAVKGMLHFGGGIVLGAVATICLSHVIEPLHGAHGSQVFVVMVGLVYFLCAVHYQRYFMLLGLIVMSGAVAVGFVPHYGWTLLGCVIAVGSVLPTLVPWSRVPRDISASAPQTTT